jgi:hypothetical protein
MITIEYMGRLGNNMSQRAIAEIFSLQTGLVVDDTNVPTELLEIIDTENTSISACPNERRLRCIRYFRKHTLGDSAFRTPMMYLEKLYGTHKHLHFGPNSFFQKSWMYLEHREMLKKFYKLPLVDSEVSSDDVAVCLRRGDLVGNARTKLMMDSIIPFEYYDYVIKTYFNDKNLHIFTDSVEHPDVLKIKEKHGAEVMPMGSSVHDLSFISKHQNIIGGIGSYHWWASFLSNAENIYFPIHNRGWGVGASAWDIEHNQIPDLHLPFVNYIHHSLYL